MKNFKFLLVAGLMAVSAPAFAQFANTGNAGNRGSNSTVDTDGYSRIELSYNPINVKWDDGDNDEDYGLTGISFGYIKGFSISKTLPLYVEAGLRLTYAFGTEDNIYNEKYYDEETGKKITVEDKYSAMRLSVPVNLAYRFSLPQSNVSITPFIGVVFNGNIIGKKTVKVDNLPNEIKDKEFIEDYLGLKEEVNFFDKDDVGNKDYQWKRFQFGWNIGANVAFNKFSVGLSYGSDFSELCEDTKTSNWAVSVGYNF